MLTKGLIPKVEFQTGDSETVIAKPIYSWFLEINFYSLEKSYVAYYDKVNPTKFVIKSGFEILTNLVIVISACVSLVLFIKGFL